MVVISNVASASSMANFLSEFQLDVETDLRCCNEHLVQVSSVTDPVERILVGRGNTYWWGNRFPHDTVRLFGFYRSPSSAATLGNSDRAELFLFFPLAFPLCCKSSICFFVSLQVTNVSCFFITPRGQSKKVFYWLLHFSTQTLYFIFTLIMLFYLCHSEVIGDHNILRRQINETQGLICQTTLLLLLLPPVQLWSRWHFQFPDTPLNQSSSIPEMSFKCHTTHTDDDDQN